MKYILILLFITNTAIAQKIYLTKEGAQRLTKYLHNCKETERELLKVKTQNNILKQTLTERDSVFELTRIKLDSIIETAENDYNILQKKYDTALELIPKKKRTKLNK
jgi:hypothetical protein